MASQTWQLNSCDDERFLLCARGHRHMFWLSTPFLVSEREPHCVMERGLQFTNALRDMLEPRGWIEVSNIEINRCPLGPPRWFIVHPSAVFAYILILFVARRCIPASKMHICVLTAAGRSSSGREWGEICKSDETGKTTTDTFTKNTCTTRIICPELGQDRTESLCLIFVQNFQTYETWASPCR